MPNNVTSTLQLTITAVDISGAQPVTRQTTIQYLGKTGDFTAFQQLAVAGADVVINLPVSPALVVYVKNLDAANTLTVKWTPQGGAAATIHVLAPGGAIAFINPVTNASGGITTLTLNPAGNNQPVEYYIGG